MRLTVSRPLLLRRPLPARLGRVQVIDPVLLLLIPGIDVCPSIHPPHPLEQLLCSCDAARVVGSCSGAFEALAEDGGALAEAVRVVGV